jgi:hypothetical protein
MAKKIGRTIREAALALLGDLTFLYRTNMKLGEMGIVGEQKTRMTVFLATLTKDLEKPVSVLLKGPSSSGKNNVVRNIVALLPPECLVTRASLTKKALAYRADSLSGKVFYLFEYHGGRDAQYLMRELQSEGSLEHEHTVMSGSDEKTKVAKQKGDPVFLSTTTEMTVYADDETRFLSLRADESEELTRAVLHSKFQPAIVKNGQPSQEVWHEALRILAEDPPEFLYPAWFSFLADQLPAEQARARRDGDRFISFLQAVAHCRSFSDGRHAKKGRVEINLADYAVAYEILNDAFSFTYGGAHPQALKVAETVRELHEELGRPVTVTEVATHNGWRKPLTYKWVDAAVDNNLIAREVGTKERNQKRLYPRVSKEKAFLPDPKLVLIEGQSDVETFTYVHPLTGESKTLSRKAAKSNDATGKK